MAGFFQPGSPEDVAESLRRAAEAAYGPARAAELEAEISGVAKAIYRVSQVNLDYRAVPPNLG